MRFPRLAAGCAAGILLWLLTAGLAAAQPPPPPHAFFGEVTIDGQPAPAGTVIEARGEGIRLGIPGNPITTTVAGRYGGPMLQEPKLIVQGRVADGLALEFYVNGVRAACAPLGGAWQESFPFQASGLTPLNLRIGDAPPMTGAVSPTPSSTVQQQAAVESANSVPTATATLLPATEDDYRTATPQTPRPVPTETAPAPPTGTQPVSGATALPQREPSPLPAATVESLAEVRGQPQVTAPPSPVLQEPVTAVPPATAEAPPPQADAAAPTAQVLAAAPRPSSTPLLQSMRLAASVPTPAVQPAQPAGGLAYLPALALGSLISAAAIAAVTLLLRRKRVSG